MSDEQACGPDDEPHVERPASSPRQWTSGELLDGRFEAIITHAGQTYRLRCTRNNKLILHK